MKPTLQVASERTDQTRLGTGTAAEAARGHPWLIYLIWLETFKEEKKKRS